MNLINTEKLLKQKLENKELDTYAVLVHYQGDEKAVFSENADEYTYFDIASMGKVLITSTLILQAVSRKKLDLEDTLDMFFEVEDDEKKKITVKEMLTHTSGILRKPITEQGVAGGIDGIAGEILSYPLGYAPGTNSIYSCNPFILLGYILEKLYGKPLEEIYHENLAGPLGLKRTAFEIALDEENAAVCYRWKDTPAKRYDSDRVLLMGTPGGSGGQQSCLYDIQKFIDAVLQKSELLYFGEYFEMAEKNYTSDFADGRGLGYTITNEQYRQTGKLFPLGSFGHTGHTGQSFFINREKDLYVILLTNATRFSFMKRNFEGYDYQETMTMREEIHNAIYEDLCAEKGEKI